MTGSVDPQTVQTISLMITKQSTRSNKKIPFHLMGLHTSSVTTEALPLLKETSGSILT